MPMTKSCFQILIVFVGLVSSILAVSIESRNPDSPTMPALSENGGGGGGGGGGSGNGGHWGMTFKATITYYGSGDSVGSPNCNSDSACGFYSYPGYNAAVSQNLFGVALGDGPGPACGTCWRLVGYTGPDGQPLWNSGVSIVVMVNNICPVQGNPLCAQDGLFGTNEYGANVNFDLCSDSGAQGAFFGYTGGLAVGTATQVDCSQWSGKVIS